MKKNGKLNICELNWIIYEVYSILYNDIKNLRDNKKNIKNVEKRLIIIFKNWWCIY
jgi:hypothetical protein